jgi:hypothetical protein
MIVNNELNWVWKEAAMLHCKLLQTVVVPVTSYPWISATRAEELSLHENFWENQGSYMKVKQSSFIETKQ